jgi:hypothetical protein
VHQGRSTQTLHPRVSGEPLCYNSPDCLVGHWTVRRDSGATAIERNGQLQRSPAKSEQFAQSQSSARRRTGLSGAPRCQSSNGRNRQNPNGWVTWLAHRTVRCAHRQTTSLMVGLVVGAINTPQPPPLQASKFFRLHIQYKS